MKDQKFFHLLIFFLFILLFNYSVKAQDSLLTDGKGNQLPQALKNKISLELDSVPLKRALQELEGKGNFHLNYNDEIIPANKLISLNIKGKPVIIILREILKGTSIDIAISNDQIVLVNLDSEVTKIIEKKYTISGFITDAATGEVLVGTNVYLHELEVGAISNAYGFYSITIREGYYSLRFSFVGYKSEELYLGLFKNLNINIELNKKAISLDTVLVTSEMENFLQSTEIGSIQLTPAKLGNIPYLLGEKDILRTLPFLPGVTFGQEGDCGFYVRGGDQDQNLTLIDEAPVYNAFHSFGFFSVFNSDAVKSFKLYKGAAPSKFGGRLSSILDIQMNEGNLKEFHAAAGIGSIFSRFTIQGPIIENKSSFIISGRRTYIDIFKIFTSNKDIKNSDLYFYDLNLKANYRLSGDDRIYLSGYMGSDGLGFADIVMLNWGNITTTLRWNHLFSNKLFSNSSLIYSHFKNSTKIYDEDNKNDVVELTSKVDDITLKQDFQYFKDANNTIDFGFNYIYHNFLPGHMSATGKDAFNFIIGKRTAQELSFYLGHEYSVNEKIKTDYGLRSTLFSVKGTEDQIEIEDIELQPYVEYHKNEITNYWGIEPRIAMTYRLNDSSSFKVDYSMNHQYIHLLTNSNSGTPLDVWQPSSAKVKPQSSHQISAGYYRNMENDSYEYSVECYYKYMKDLIDYKDGAQLYYRTYFESELVFGKGWAYGIEFFLKKKTGQLTGWIGYTLSKSGREFPEANGGNPFPAKYSRTHDLSIISSYKLDEHWTFSANFIYASGHNVTVPYGKYIIDNQTINAYTPRNGYRLPPYHRLDIGISYTNNVGGIWNLSLYNIYARKNTYAIAIQNSDSVPGLKEAVRLSLFTIVPSISYSLTF
jgi:hypothetical protein